MIDEALARPDGRSDLRRRCSRTSSRPPRATCRTRRTGSAAAGRGLQQPADAETARRNVDTGDRARSGFDNLGRTLTDGAGRPQRSTRRSRRILDAKKEMFDERREFRLGDRRGARLRRRCCAEGYPRAPVGPGFGPRHVQPAPCGLGRSGRPSSKYIPLSTTCRMARFEVLRQPAFGIRRARLRIWLFARPIPRRWSCGRRSSAISPTAPRPSSTSSSPRARPSGCAPTASCCCCRTAMKGQGPEHSSRAARALPAAVRRGQYAGRATCTTPANYFHILRRQMQRAFPQAADHHDAEVAAAAQARRVAAPRTSPARATSGASCPTRNAPPDEDVRRLVLCTGKVSYELMEARDKAGDRRHLDRPHRAALSRSPASRWPIAPRSG